MDDPQKVQLTKDLLELATASPKLKILKNLLKLATASPKLKILKNLLKLATTSPKVKILIRDTVSHTTVEVSKPESSLKEFLVRFLVLFPFGLGCFWFFFFLH